MLYVRQKKFSNAMLVIFGRTNQVKQKRKEKRERNGREEDREEIGRKGGDSDGFDARDRLRYHRAFRSRRRFRRRFFPQTGFEIDDSLKTFIHSALDLCSCA